MSSTAGNADGNGRAPGRPLTLPGENLLQVAVPPGTPDETRAAIQRLIELTSILARRAAQLQEALDSRVIVEQAKGMLAERYGITPDDAFSILRRSARSNRMKLHELARKVVESPATPREFDVVGLPGLIRN